MTDSPAPAARGVRLDWNQVPERVRAAFETWAGSRVASATSQVSGFSPGVAARVRLADGRGVFIKAIGPEPNPDSPEFHRREGSIVAALPPHVPVPRLLWSFDEGEGGWIVLVFEEVHGRHPSEPWRDHELQRVLDGLADLFDKLTPSPLAGAWPGWPGGSNTTACRPVESLERGKMTGGTNTVRSPAQSSVG
jgi:hypothetical protein